MVRNLPKLTILAVSLTIAESGAQVSQGQFAHLENRVGTLEGQVYEVRRDVSHISGSKTRPVSAPIITTNRPSPATSRVHVVRKGENAFRIAKHYGVDYHTLRSTNRLGKKATIYPGQRLVIPGPGAVPSGRRHGQGRSKVGPAVLATHTVLRGDTLSSISRAWGTSPQEIQRINNLPNPNAIFIGQRLRVPQGGGSVTTYAPPPPVAAPPRKAPLRKVSPAPKPKPKRTYTAPVSQRVASNRVPPKSGAKPPVSSRSTTITSPPSTPTVRRKATPRNVPRSTPRPQTPLAPPAPAVTPPGVAGNGAAIPKPSTQKNFKDSYGYYVFQSGDSLDSISRTYNTDPNELRKINRFSPDRSLKPGDLIIVPAEGAWTPSA